MGRDKLMKMQINRIYQSKYDAILQLPIAPDLAWRKVRLTLTAARQESRRTYLRMGTVVTTILSGAPGKRNERRFEMPTACSSVRFSMRCDAGQIYLLIGGEDGQPRAFHQMERGKVGRWDLVLRLGPGTYRYRYYAENGVVTTYVRPDEADVTPVRMDGLDAVLTVPSAVPPRGKGSLANSEGTKHRGAKA